MQYYCNHRYLPIVALMLCSLSGCNDSSSFEGGATNPVAPAEQQPAAEIARSQDSADQSLEAPASPAPNPESSRKNGLRIAVIQDQAVNTGKTSPNYSEPLRIKLLWAGGVGTVKFSASTSSNSPNAQIIGNSFEWIPGYRDTGGQYQSEEGEHAVEISAVDGAGNEDRVKFNVKIVPLEWQLSVVEPADPNLRQRIMTTEFMVAERLHPERQYSHDNDYRGSQLNVAQCISFDPSTAAITLMSPPQISAASENTGEGIQKLVHEIDFPLSEQLNRFEHAVFVSWVNLKPTPDLIQSAEGQTAPNIRFYYAYARCNNADWGQERCKQEASRQYGLSNYFYCSEYFRNPADKYSELKDIYCSIAARNGVGIPDCP